LGVGLDVGDPADGEGDAIGEPVMFPQPDVDTMNTKNTAPSSVLDDRNGLT
jgi:hypothetical protein